MPPSPVAHLSLDLGRRARIFFVFEFKYSALILTSLLLRLLGNICFSWVSNAALSLSGAGGWHPHEGAAAAYLRHWHRLGIVSRNSLTLLFKLLFIFVILDSQMIAVMLPLHHLIQLPFVRRVFGELHMLVLN